MASAIRIGYNVGMPAMEIAGILQVPIERVVRHEPAPPQQERLPF